MSGLTNHSARDAGRDERGAQDVLKGLLILAIVLGHNRLLLGSVKESFYLLYFWHVQAFFFVALAQRRATNRFLPPQTLIVRYMTPFITIAGGLALGMAVLSRSLTPVGAILAGALTGYAPVIKDACGLYLYWFLPTFVGFNLLAWLVWRGGAARITGLTLIAAGWLLAVFGPNELTMRLGAWLPFGLIIAGYLLPSAWFYTFAMEHMKQDGQAGRRMTMLCAAIVIGALVLVATQTMQVNISMYKFGETPAIIAFASLASSAATLLITRVARLFGDRRLLQMLGRKSMTIFVFHQPIQIALIMVMEKLAAHGGLIPPSRPLSFALGLIPMIGAISAVLLVDALLTRMPRLRQILFPMDASTLCAALRGKPLGIAR